MRKSLTCLVVLGFVLFAMGLMAQTSSSSNPQHATTTTTTTSTQQSTITGTERTVEGCVMKEASDFFLSPAQGNPIELQPSAGQDLSAHEGHKVKVRGIQASLAPSSAAGTSSTGGAAGVASGTTNPNAGNPSSNGSISTPAGSSASGNAGAASGTGNDLHRLASKQMTVANLDHVAETCPVNWNSKVPSKK
jgi:hypothetical protein